jgi:hypothetical protein
LLDTQEVTGSSPVLPTTDLSLLYRLFSFRPLIDSNWRRIALLLADYWAAAYSGRVPEHPRGVAVSETASIRLDADLLVVPGDPVSDEAIELIRSKNVTLQIIPVSEEDYLNPRDVPKLLTTTGQYYGLPSIERVIDHALTETS